MAKKEKPVTQTVKVTVPPKSKTTDVLVGLDNVFPFMIRLLEKINNEVCALQKMVQELKNGKSK